MEILFNLWTTRDGLKHFCVHQLLEQRLPNHINVCNNSDKDEVLLPVLGIIPLVQMHTYSPKKWHSSCEV